MTTPLDRLRAALADRYALERELGQGGMATVYLARDLKHDRQVAVKVLRPELAAVIGAERFLAEIKTTANLQHPHILPLHDSGEVNGTVFYVMPFVEGESLRDRLTRERQLPVADAVRITTEIAGALDYAHRHGVIHRDIKPENVLLHDGRALVADFGIALAAASGEGATRMTETGMSLGTPTYMSPEQAMGERDLDGRTDVYALGCVCYEMLTGEPPFTGPTAQAIVAKVMASEPEPVTTLRRAVSPAVAAAVHTAIEKLPVDRFASAAKFAEALAAPSTGAVPGLSGTRAVLTGRGSRTRWGLVAVVATMAFLAGAGVVRMLSAPVPPRVTRIGIAMPPGQELLNTGGIRTAFAPDGASFLYPGPGSAQQLLWRRYLDRLEAVPVPGTEGASSAVFSPDGSQIAFVTLTPFALWLVPAEGGRARRVSDGEPSGGGVDWSTDGFLYYDGRGGLERVRPDGSDREMVVPLDTTRGESGVAWPEALPDGRGVLFRVRSAGEDNSGHQVVAWDARSGEHKALVRAVAARYVTTGHLLFLAADGTLFAQRFDLDRLELVGSPKRLWDGVAIAGYGSNDVAVSPTGDLLYSAGRVSSTFSEPVWVDRTGGTTRVDTLPEEGLIGGVAVAPDGKSLAFRILRATESSFGDRIFVKRLDGSPTQLVSREDGRGIHPTWGPGGRELYYVRPGAGIVRRRADGSGDAELVVPVGRLMGPPTLDPAGRTFIWQGEVGPSEFGLATFEVGRDTTPRVLVSGNLQGDPALSPDGRWLAYSSREGSGRQEVVVVPFPDMESRRQQVSVEGGSRPKWNPAGGELFYVNDDGEMMAATLDTSDGIRITGRSRLFRVSAFGVLDGAVAYDVAPDGNRFLMLSLRTRDVGAESLILVQNFTEELRRLEAEP